MSKKLTLRPGTSPALALKLENPQAYLLEAFAENGLTLSKVANTLLQVMDNQEDGPSRVAAAKLFLETTVGRAPSSTNSKNLNVTIRRDKFFDEDVFSKTPAPEV